MKYYAGIGSRETPKDILKIMEDLSIVLESDGYILRSGGADGADYAFAKSVDNKEIFLPWNGFNGVVSKYLGATPEAYRIAESNVGHWDKLKPGAKKLHARNVHQIFGRDIGKSKPVSFVVCWTKDGKKVGGTATAINLAESYGIPVFNLANEEHLNRVALYIAKHKHLIHKD